MFGHLVKAVMLLTFPALVFYGGVQIMSKLSDRDYVTKRLRDKLNPYDATSLSQRMTGYDLDAVSRHWGALDDRARMSEARFLEMDLVFPFFYGGALAGALLLAWAALGRPFHPAWLVGPIAITVAADWIENLVQLGQLRRYAESGTEGLQSGWIWIASAATIVKLAGVLAATVLLLCLTVWMVVRTPASTP